MSVYYENCECDSFIDRILVRLLVLGTSCSCFRQNESKFLSQFTGVVTIVSKVVSPGQSLEQILVGSGTYIGKSGSTGIFLLQLTMSPEGLTVTEIHMVFGINLRKGWGKKGLICRFHNLNLIRIILSKKLLLTILPF